MEILYIISAVLQSFAISAGVGSSTIAVTQFFSAINDGKIDESERRMMGVTYAVLRIAMGLILVSTAVQGVIIYYYGGMGTEYFNPFSVGVWTVIAVLFLNALAMTKHWLPSTLGPGIQAGSWYTLGMMFAFIPLGLTNFTFVQFLLGYAGMICLAVAIVNGVMSYKKG
ncbi:MAG: hypothetical protein WDZ56_01430 [Candidatus Paceibacterota bacterium]